MSRKKSQAVKHKQTDAYLYVFGILENSTYSAQTLTVDSFHRLIVHIISVLGHFKNEDCVVKYLVFVIFSNYV